MNFRKRMLKHGSRTGVLAVSIGALIAAGGISNTALGQEDEDDEAADEGEAIVVTGTRIRRNDYTSANATVVITREDMDNLGVFSVADMINQLPNNIANRTPETDTANAFMIGQSIANMRGLNTYFGTRTLTLVDSRRVPATNTGGSVDLNMIPSALVSRIETVTGGATATYGAGALAGVVNVIVEQNKENVTVDLSYSTTDEGDGDNIEFSVGAGREFFDRRGHLTIGFDHTDNEGIDDCMNREVCQSGLGLIQNGGFFGGTSRPYEVRGGIGQPNQPMWLVEDGQRYVTPREGFTWDDPTMTGQSWTWTEDGRDIVQVYDDLTAAEIQILRSEGPLGANSYGIGPPAWINRALRTSTDRQNLFTSFTYDFESGVEIDVQMTIGQNESIAGQNVPSQSGAVFPGIYSDSAYLQQGSPAMQSMLLARMGTNFFDFVDNAPYRGNVGCTGAFGAPPCAIVEPPPPYYPIYKDWSGQIQRYNTSVTETDRFSFGANGDLFEGGSWTWDAYISTGTSTNETEVGEYPSANRSAMATDAVFQFGEDPSDPNAEIVCRVSYDDPNNPNDMGDAIRAQWLVFLEYALADEAPRAQEYYDVLSEGCAPLNPLGLAASPEGLAYAFPSIFEGADNSQDALSFSVSGDAWRGIGNAGPMRMAAGLDYSEDTTVNFTKPGRDEILSRDFTLNFGDPWAGVTSNKEAWVEFDLPLMRDRVAADYVAINLSQRFTRNESERLTGTPSPNQNDVTSWKATLEWQPVDLMRVRITRSADTRAPSARELYALNSPSANSFSRQQVSNPWVNDDPLTTDNESTDLYRSGTAGGNTQLSEEVALNETVGVVFTPTELLAGLQISVDYYQTTVKGGIDSVSSNQTLSRCQLEIDGGIPPAERGFCNQIEFGAPRTDIDPSLIEIPEYSDIEVINASQENVEPFWSRGIDFSVSYATQLSGGAQISGRVLTTRFLEQSVDLGGWWGRQNVAGQTGSNGLANIFGGFGTNYSPTPDISGNVFLTYAKNAFSVTAQARYVGSGDLNIQESWIGPGETGHYRQLNNDAIQFSVPYASNLENTTNQPHLPSWTTFNLSFNYDLGRSRLSLDNFENLSVYVNIDNVTNQVPSFFSGNGAGGLNTTFFSAMGREYRMGMRMEF